MPGIVALVSAISDDVVARLAAGYPNPGVSPALTLTAGKILLGRQHTIEGTYYPPRIVFVPRGSRFGPRDTYNRSNIATNPSAEMVAQWEQRSIHSDILRFEVECWGVSNPPDVDADFDVTQVLYQALITSIRTKITGGYALEDGDWPDQDPNEAQIQKVGHRFVFAVAISTPILDVPYPSVKVSGISGTVGFIGNTAPGEVVIVNVP